MANSVAFACGSIHQGVGSFSSESRGRQCIYISLAGLTFHHAEMPVTMWNSQLIDQIIVHGDSMYRKALADGRIPDSETLSVNHLPVAVVWGGQIPTKSENSPSVVNDIMKPSIAMADREPQCLMKPSIEMAAREPQSQFLMKTSIEMAASEPQCKANGNQTLFVKYGSEFQGPTENGHEIEAPYFSLHSALMNTFAISNCAIIILEGYAMALIKGLESGFYFFDSHARNSCGMPDPDGTAVVLKFTDIVEVENFVCTLSNETHSNYFEIVPVQFLKQSDRTLSSEINEINSRINDLGTATARTSILCESEAQRQTKLEKMRLYQLKRKLTETEAEKRSRLEKEKQNKKRKRSEESEISKRNRLDKARLNFHRRISKETEDQKLSRLEKKRNCRKRKFSDETEDEKQIRLDKDRQRKRRKISQETANENKIRLDKDKQNKKRKISQETADEKQIRLDKNKSSKKRRISQQNECEKQTRLEVKLYKRSRRLEKNNEAPENNSEDVIMGARNKQDYLKEFDVVKNGKLHEQSWAKSNIADFHKSVKFTTYQCSICREAWPLKCRPRIPGNYMCLRCSRDKTSPKKFSAENGMVPSQVPLQLQNLTQIEEMIIARALPIMRVYIKPGGQRGYSGHCINLPQNVQELASSLPRYPKDLPVIIVKMKGRDNTFRDITVRKQKVHDALLWLMENNLHYADLILNVECLNSLPENGIPSDLLTCETEDDIVSNETPNFDLGPTDSTSSEDQVYNASTDMSSFLPVGKQQQEELEAMRNQLLTEEPMECGPPLKTVQ